MTKEELGVSALPQSMFVSKLRDGGYTGADCLPPSLGAGQWHIQVFFFYQFVTNELKLLKKNFPSFSY